MNKQINNCNRYVLTHKIFTQSNKKFVPVYTQSELQIEVKTLVSFQNFCLKIPTF